MSSAGGARGNNWELRSHQTSLVPLPRGTCGAAPLTWVYFFILEGAKVPDGVFVLLLQQS